MLVIERHIQQIRKDVDEAWKAQAREPSEKHNHKVQELVIVSLGLWRSTTEVLATCPPRDRQSERDVAGLLRVAEQSMTAALELAESRIRGGADIKRATELATALREVRGMILMPTARQIAERDPEGRTPQTLRDLLLDRVDFVAGRPVFSPEVAKQFPNPLPPEPATRE